MPYLPSSSWETESSSSLRHCVTTLRSLLRISWFMSGCPLRMRCRRFLLQFLQPAGHKVVQCEADDSNGFDGLFRPRIPNLLSGTSGIVLRTVSSVHDVIATLDSSIKRLLDFAFVPA